MKAAIVREFGGGFGIEDVTIAEPVGQEVLVDVKAAGLCHSDETAATANIGWDVPVLLGHEVAGVVSAVGSEVRGLEVGDHVAAAFVSYCGACVRCLTGKVSLCENPGVVQREGRLLDADGKPIGQGIDIGGFAEQVLVHENQLAPVPKEIPFPQASLLGCGVITGSGAILNAAQVQAGETVAVIGTGGVGLNAISGAVIAGASTIIAVDVADEKLETATKFGATHTVNSRSIDPVAAVKEFTGGRGVDHAFDMVGIKAVTQPALDMVVDGGGLYLIGLGNPENVLEVTTYPTLMAQKKIQGVRMGRSTPKRDIPMIAELYLQGRYNLDDLVSKEISLEEINEGYESLKDPSINRVVITKF